MYSIGGCGRLTLQDGRASPLRSAETQTVRRSNLDKDEMFLSYERLWEKFKRVSNWLPHSWPGPSSQSSAAGQAAGKLALWPSLFNLGVIEERTSPQGGVRRRC